MNNIYILSGPVNSGKTTRLKNWVNKQSNVAGILSPGVDGKRKLYSIASRKFMQFEVENIIDKKEIVHIGSFNFLKDSFDWAKKEIEKSLLLKPDWMIIDEVGMLELKGKGFDSALKAMLKEKYESINFLFVIRDRLVSAVISNYGLKKKDIHYVDFL